MTTIAADKAKMVSDSKITMENKGGDTAILNCSKITVKGRAIIGTCGESYLGDEFIKWYGTRKKKPACFGKNADFEALVLTEKGLYHYDEFLSGGRLDNQWFAVGSGSFAALGALHAGRTLEEAVEIACKVDNQSGLPLQVIALQTVVQGS